MNLFRELRHFFRQALVDFSSGTPVFARALARGLARYSRFLGHEEIEHFSTP